MWFLHVEHMPNGMCGLATRQCVTSLHLSPRSALIAMKSLCVAVLVFCWIAHFFQGLPPNPTLHCHITFVALFQSLETKYEKMSAKACKSPPRACPIRISLRRSPQAASHWVVSLSSRVDAKIPALTRCRQSSLKALHGW